MIILSLHILNYFYNSCSDLSAAPNNGIFLGLARHWIFASQENVRNFFSVKPNLRFFFKFQTWNYGQTQSRTRNKQLLFASSLTRMASFPSVFCIHKKWTERKQCLKTKNLLKATNHRGFVSCMVSLDQNTAQFTSLLQVLNDFQSFVVQIN